MPQFTFVIGKGGVGKTTVSAALALYRAHKSPRSRLLLLSTDPAHSLGDVLDLKLSDRKTRVGRRGLLYARQLDAAGAVDAFLTAQREGVLQILESGSLFTREELQPLLDSALPGMSEVAALLAVHDLLTSDYDEVIIDTAPMGHTLRLLQLPRHLQRFLRLLEIAARRDQVLAAHFGGHAAQSPYLARWQQMVGEIVRALNTACSGLLLVTSPESFSLNEAVRARDQLLDGDKPLQIDGIVLNRAERHQSACANCARRALQTRNAESFLQRQFHQVRVYVGEDPGMPIVGSGALLGFGKHLFEGAALKPREAGSSRVPKVTLKPVTWPVLDTPLTLTLGKGGVGKTTVSAGMTFHSRVASPRSPATICSIDPAPSLDDVFETGIGNQPRSVLGDAKLYAAEIDAVAEYSHWASRMQRRVEGATSTEIRGVHLDLSFERDLFLAVLDVVPPGVDEIFATFRILDLVDGGGQVQIDMAPTGHALEVLRTPARLLGWARVLLKTLAHHRTLPLARDAAVEIATVSQRVRDLVALLNDGRRSKVWVVMLAEPLPDRETRRLLAELAEMHAPVAGVIVNRVLMEAGNCRRCARTRKWQQRTLARLRDLQLPVLVVPQFQKEIRGKRGLQQLTKAIWQLQ